MAEPEIPSCGRKRESNDSSYEESEDAIKYDSNDSEESDYPVEDDSDDPTYETLEGQGDRKIWKQYYREWNESEGFDVSVHPGTSFMAGLCQMDHYLKHSESKQEYTELCKLAIEDFNSKNDKMYVLEEIVNLNATFAAGEWLYFTFTARDTIVDAASDDDAIKTFQAMVWSGIDKTVEVSFCRLKKFISNEEKKKNKKKKKKKSQLDGKAVTEVEQDKPSLVKSFVPGLVIRGVG